MPTPTPKTTPRPLRNPALRDAFDSYVARISRIVAPYLKKKPAHEQLTEERKTA